MQVKMIASWGNAGAGKSTVALALAAKLAASNKNVVIISTDAETPALPMYLPFTEKLTLNNSIGELLSMSFFSYDNLKDKIHLHPKSPRIGFMGLVSGENQMNYKAFERNSILEFLRILHDSPFEYIIFDCKSNAMVDGLTLYALEAANFVLRIVTPDVRGYEFQKSQLAWLKNYDYADVARHIKVASPVFKTTPIKQAELSFNGFDFVLPFSSGVYDKFSAGELLSGFTETDGIKFESEIKKLTRRIMENEQK